MTLKEALTNLYNSLVNMEAKFSDMEAAYIKLDNDINTNN